jgi:uncharacterized protein (DUF1697 family)
MSADERRRSTTFVALLRGINVGGHKKVAMSDVRDIVAEVGFSDGRTLLQSGNVVFRARPRPGAELERVLETSLEQRVGGRIDFFVRSADEWQAIVAQNPFSKEAKRDPGHLLLMLLKAVPDAKNVTALKDAIPGPEIVRAGGRHAYIVYPDGVGRSKLTHGLLEKKLGTRVTGRNWNTVLKLWALVNV